MHSGNTTEQTRGETYSSAVPLSSVFGVLFCNYQRSAGCHLTVLIRGAGLENPHKHARIYIDVHALCAGFV